MKEEALAAEVKPKGRSRLMAEGFRTHFILS
jgi:hypothetical protein